MLNEQQQSREQCIGQMIHLDYRQSHRSSLTCLTSDVLLAFRVLILYFGCSVYCITFERLGTVAVDGGEPGCETSGCEECEVIR